jgi:hypothetical protein
MSSSFGQGGMVTVEATPFRMNHSASASEQWKLTLDSATCPGGYKTRILETLLHTDSGNRIPHFPVRLLYDVYSATNPRPIPNTH